MSAVAPNTTEMETVVHKKVAGNGYEKGSPLYDKQKQLRQANTDTPANRAAYLKAYGLDGSKTANQNHAAYLKWLQESLWTILVSMGVYFVAVLVVAYFYHNGRTQPPRSRDRHADKPMGPEILACGFTYCIFDWHNMYEDKLVCFMALCCPLIRMADTISRVPQPPIAFWPCLIGLLILICLEPFTGGITGIIFIILWLVWRSKLRNIYNHSHHKARAAVEDICMVCCFGTMCGCCMLVQEAREVEYTQAARH